MLNGDPPRAVRSLILHDTNRVRLLRLVASLSLPDCWIAAGFVRNAVWDSLHGRPPSPPAGDVDVIWFDPLRTERDIDVSHEARLAALDGSIAWSVKNQARMHLRNGDAPYRSSCDAMRFWPETATAVAVRLGPRDELDVAAPFELSDLCAGVLRPTPKFRGANRSVFADRVRSKRWREHWPLLRVEDS